VLGADSGKENHAMPTEKSDGLEDIGIVNLTVRVCLCRTGEKIGWLSRHQVSGKLWPRV